MMMRLKLFLIKYLPFFLFTFLTIGLSANTMVNEIGIGINGMESTFEIKKNKSLKSLIPLKIDFQKIILLEKRQIITPEIIENPLDKLAPKVVIDDVVVFLDGNNSLEGMIVYHGATTTISSSNCLSTYSPG